MMAHYFTITRMLKCCPCECVTRVGLVALLSALQLNDNLQIEIEIDASVNPLGALGVYMISASLPTITKLGHPHDHGPHDDMMRPHVVNYALFE